MRSFIENIPKAELHVHIIGTMSSDLCIEIAKRNNIEVPSKEIIDQRRENYSNLQDFLLEFNFCSRLLKTSQDFYDVAYSYLTVCSKEKIMYTEMQFNTAFYVDLGISFATIFEAFLKASDDAMVNFQVKAN